MITVVSIPAGGKIAHDIAQGVRDAGFACALHTIESIEEIDDLSGVAVLVSLAVPCGAAEMDRMPALRAIVSPLLGYDWIDVAEATRRGIAVANSEVPENREGMAEATIMLLLVLLYRLHETEALLRNNAAGDTLERHLLKSRTIGIIGFGGISRAVIDRLASWGCRFLVHSQAMPQDIAHVRFVPLDELLSNSDAILVLTSLNANTRHMLGREQFDLVRPGTLLVNTARGAIIDESALLAALRTGKIGAAALDVFEQEPLPSAHPLRALPNVILTPHAIGHNHEAFAAIPRVAAENAVLFAKGLVPASCVNPVASQKVQGV